VWGINPENITRTLDLIGFLAKDVGNIVDAIELINEPSGFLGPPWPETIRNFWQSGYEVVRDVAGVNVTVVIEDAFLGVQSWAGFLAEPSAVNTLMDVVRFYPLHRHYSTHCSVKHEYQIFSDTQLAFTWDEHISVDVPLTLCIFSH
jgi:glucan 1,3-beta-glucosidase